MVYTDLAFYLTLFVGTLDCSGSHVVLRLVRKYPEYKIVNLDKLDYCSSQKNLESIAALPNYVFVKVRTSATSACTRGG